MNDDDIEIVLGRTEGGSFVRVKHVPTGRHRYVGPLHGESPEAVQSRLLKELLLELREARVDGYLEVEPDCFVSVQIPSRITAAQLGTVRRAHAPFQSLSLSEVRQLLLKSRDALLGPYLWPQLAAECCRQLREAGFDAAVVVGGPSQPPM